MKKGLKTGMITALLLAAVLMQLPGFITSAGAAEKGKSIASLGIEDGIYTMTIETEGGWVGTEITNPARVRIKDGEMTGLLEFESNYYSCVKQDGKTIEPQKKKGNSKFVISIPYTDAPIPVTVMKTEFGQTMQTEMTVSFKSAEYEKAKTAYNPGGAAVRAGFVFFLFILIVSAVMLFLHKKMKSWGV